MEFVLVMCFWILVLLILYVIWMDVCVIFLLFLMVVV